ncbi:ABC transporter ATP-binding protein, partial [Streptomyces microflavus]
DTPAALLGTPASQFVRDFVGADRGLRRLAVTPVTREVLDGEATDATLPELPLGRSAYDALAAMLTAGTDAVLVTADGRLAGTLSRARVLDLGQPGS